MKTYPSDTKIYNDAEAWAVKATAVIASDAKRTPAEQAALDAVDEQRWVLWHTDAMTDLALAVIRLLSRADLLRDKEHEKRQAKADTFWSADAERRSTGDRRALGELSELVDEAADRLESGADPAEVAALLRATQGAISSRRETAAATDPGHEPATT